FCHENGMEIAFTSPGWIPQEVFDELNIPAPSCGACLSNMAITPSGNIVPCQSWLSDDVMGNILTDDWDSVWNSDKCRDRREYSAEMLGECPLRRERDEK
ncbi:MAG: SPASM domain-containing protein, partial [Lachnospiraceae bacterium]|nr:SPASM domain-containing protein [Lachnospiraceae bacterium]